MGLGISSCVIANDDGSVPVSELARALDAGDHVTVLSCLRERPQLLSQKCLPSGNTVWHHLARSGDAQLLTALFALVEQTHDPRNQPWLIALSQQHQQQYSQQNLRPDPGGVQRQESSSSPTATPARALTSPPRISSESSQVWTRFQSPSFLTPRGGASGARRGEAAGTTFGGAAAVAAGSGDQAPVVAASGRAGAAAWGDDNADVARTARPAAGDGSDPGGGGSAAASPDTSEHRPTADALYSSGSLIADGGSTSTDGNPTSDGTLDSSGGGSGDDAGNAVPSTTSVTPAGTPASLATTLLAAAADLQSPDASVLRVAAGSGASASSASASISASASASATPVTPGSPPTDATTGTAAATPIFATSAHTSATNMWVMPPPRQTPLERAMSRRSEVQAAPLDGGGAGVGSGGAGSIPGLGLSVGDPSSGTAGTGRPAMPRLSQRDAPLPYSPSVNERRRWLVWRRLSGNGFSGGAGGGGTGGGSAGSVSGGGGSGAAAVTAAAAQAALRPGAAALAALLSSRNARGQTPLMLACSHGQATIVALLLRKGADPWVADPHKSLTALHYAAIFGHYMCAKLLLGLLPSSLAASAALSRLPEHVVTAGSGRRWLLEARSRGGATALHLAADLGHTSVVELLLQYGAELTARVAPAPPLPLALLPAAVLPRRFSCLAAAAGATALHLAARSNDMATALALLRHFYQADNPTATDPRVAEDARGRRPHQIAYANRSYRLAVVLRPDYPPRWLFGPDSGGSSELDPERPAETPGVGSVAAAIAAAASGASGIRLSPSAVPPLAALASAVLRRALLQELDELEDMATNCTAVVVVAAAGDGDGIDIDANGAATDSCGGGTDGPDSPGGGSEGAAMTTPEQTPAAAAGSLAAAAAMAAEAPVDVGQAVAVARVDDACVAATLAAAGTATKTTAASATQRTCSILPAVDGAVGSDSPSAPAPDGVAFRGTLSTPGTAASAGARPSDAGTATATAAGSGGIAAGTANNRFRQQQLMTHESFVGLPGAVEATPSLDGDVHDAFAASADIDVDGGGLPHIADSLAQLRGVRVARPASAAPAAAAAAAAAGSQCGSFRRSASATAASVRHLSRSVTTPGVYGDSAGAASASFVLSLGDGGGRAGGSGSGGGCVGSVRSLAARSGASTETTAAGAVTAVDLLPPATAGPASATALLLRMSDGAVAPLPPPAAAAVSRPQSPEVPPAVASGPWSPSTARQTAWGPRGLAGLAVAPHLPAGATTAAAAAALAGTGGDEVVPAFASPRPAAAATAPSAVVSAALPAVHAVPEPHPDATRRVSPAAAAATTTAAAAATTAAAVAGAVDNSCGICLEDTTDGSPMVLVSLRGCRHRLCVACARRLVDTALPRRPATCPFCRGKIPGFDLSPPDRYGGCGRVVATEVATATAKPPVTACTPPPPVRTVASAFLQEPQPLLPGQPIAGGSDSDSGGGSERHLPAATTAAVVVGA